ncbi:MAG TPA: hypothetical protein VFI49_10765 [Rudaea sp.]|nr:hypothetical protein [Rudaea sp.]
MNRIRYTLSFLLLAGVACVHAQQPIVKINSDSSATECDVTALAGAPIFQLDATGNVLVKGTLSGNGCGGGGGGTTTATFGLNPPASGVVINGGTTSVPAGSVVTVPLTYQAYNATNGCSVGTPTTTGTCPAITASNGSCTAGAQGSCAPTAATLSIPTIAQMGNNTSCGYTATATCNPGSVTSSAVLTVTNNGGGGDIPAACSSLATIHTSTGTAWSRLTTGTSVKYGDGTTATKDPTDYVSVWSYPGTTAPWPGIAGGQTRPNVMSNLYLSEKFVVPSDTSLLPRWSWTGSGIGSNFSLTISICPGDFGQTGTQLTQGCKLDQSNSSNGLTSYVNPTQQGIACTVNPGKTYYLNVLPNANLPANNVSSPSSPVCSTCTPWIVRN